MASQVIVPEMYCLDSNKQVWTPVVGETLPVDMEEHNAKDPMAAVRTYGIVVGHVPKACSLASNVDK